MAAVKSFVWSLGSDNLAGFIIGIGLVMLAWVFYVGDIVLGAV